MSALSLEGKWNNVFGTIEEVREMEHFKFLKLNPISEKIRSDPDEILLPKEHILKDQLSMEFPNKIQMVFWFKVIHQVAWKFREKFKFRNLDKKGTMNNV
jgi:hypothetical protein